MARKKGERRRASHPFSRASGTKGDRKVGNNKGETKEKKTKNKSKNLYIYTPLVVYGQSAPEVSPDISQRRQTVGRMERGRIYKIAR